MKNRAQFLAFAALCFAVTGCKVEQTQKGKLPEVEVNATGGQVPEFNVEGPKVQVGEKNEVIKVPTVKVTTPDHK